MKSDANLRLQEAVKAAMKISYFIYFLTKGVLDMSNDSRPVSWYPALWRAIVVLLANDNATPDSAYICNEPSSVRIQ